MKEQEPAGSNWVEVSQKKRISYDFSKYRSDTDITFSSEAKEFKLLRACLRKDTEIWVPVAEFVKEINYIFIKLNSKDIIIIKDDGTPVQLFADKTETQTNNKPFSTIRKPLAVFQDEFMLSLDSLEDITGFSFKYVSGTNTVNIIRTGKKTFSTFVPIEKPVITLKKKKAAKFKKDQEVRKFDLPRAMRKELLPNQYRPDIDLKLDSSFKYFHDILDKNRTRYMEQYLKGKAYGVDVYGHLSMKDYSSGDKRTFDEDAQHLSFFKGGNGIKLLDNYIRLPNVRSQSQSYWGTEVVTDNFFINKVAIGELQPVYIPRLNGTGSAKYFSNIYASEQEWVKTGEFNLSAVEMFTHSKTEFPEDKGSTAYPRRNFVYLLDNKWKIRPGLDFYNTFAQCAYVPDNKENIVVPDYDYRTEVKLKQDRFNMTSSFEFVGDRYVSLSIPTTYQDYLTWRFNSNYKIAKNFSINVGGNMNRDNVAFDDVPTLHSRGMSASGNLRLPWKQSVNFGWNYNRYLSRGGTQDSSGNEYRSYRTDYYKSFGTASLQLGYQYYRIDPIAAATGSMFYHTYSATLYKNFPNLYGSSLRFYQDITERKQLSMNGLPTTTTWNTGISGKYYLLRNLSFSSDWRLRTTQNDETSDSAIMSISNSVDYDLSSATKLGFTYSLSNVDFYDERRSTKDWSILFNVKHIFDFKTAEKWGSVRVHVFEDTNGNDLRDEGDNDLKEVLAYIVKGRGAETGSDGSVLIKKVVPGEREVRLDMRGLPVEMVIKGDQTKNVKVEPLKTADVTFIVVTSGTIEGRVFVDMNNNGIFDENIDVAVPNVRIFLTPDNKDTLTFSDGSYRFDSVYPGEYLINVDFDGIPKAYKLALPRSREDREVEVNPKDRIENKNFVFKSRPIKIKYF